jgi:hypothetical protein
MKSLFFVLVKSHNLVLLADFGWAHYRCQSTTWNLHTTQLNYFAPTYSEVVNLTGFPENKGLDV